MILNVFVNTIRKISVRGRYSIALRGCELLLAKKQIPGDAYSEFFSRAWEYTLTDNFSEWEASIGDDFEKDFGDNDLTAVIHRTLAVGDFHLYGSIDSHGEIQICYALWDILDILHKYDIVLEDVRKVRKFTPFFSMKELLREMDWGYGAAFRRSEIVPLIEYNANLSIRNLVDM